MIHRTTNSHIAVIVVFCAIVGSSCAAVVAPITANTQAHNIQGGGGISSLFDDNEGKITKPDVNDPNTWTSAGQAWPDDWQGNGPLNRADNPTPTNSKVGWVTFDFGTVVSLDEIFIWNLSEATAQTRRVNTYNIYHSNSPSVAPVSGSGNNTASLDYDFASGGWTQLVGTRSLTAYGSGGGAANGIETIGVSAQYIGLEFITYGGDTNRVGLNEVVFTEAAAIPEPSTALLGAIGSLMLLRRRR
ncbi:MAG: hypothetical protein ACO3SO_03310 [Luteolibacter sp.]